MQYTSSWLYFPRLTYLPIYLIKQEARHDLVISVAELYIRPI